MNIETTSAVRKSSSLTRATTSSSALSKTSSPQIGFDSIHTADHQPTNDALYPSINDARMNHQYMLAHGQMWQKAKQYIPLDETKPIESLSERNIQMLKQHVSPLTQEEAIFYVNVMKQPWYMTHFSSNHTFKKFIRKADRSIELKSFDRRKLEQPGKVVNTHAAIEDIEEFAGTNFVYFCLEIGNKLKKKQTRSNLGNSGSTIVRTLLDQPATRYAMSMHGDIFDGLRVAPRLGLTKDDERRLNGYLARFEEQPLNSTNGFMRTVFFSPEIIKQGTTLQVILDARQIPEKCRNQLLTRTSSDDLNNLVSSMSRTQIMVPDTFVSSDYQRYEMANDSKKFELRQE